MNDQYEDGREVSAMSVEGGTVALLNRSEIDMQVATAHKFPRSIKRFRQEALQMVTLNESVAESCIYALPRSGKTIEGPSARFAEVVASAWGNCRAGARVVSDQGDFITAQGMFYDCERNVGLTYEVQRRITDKNNRRFNADMIGVTGNAASSIALRNAILKGVPKAFWDDMYQAARAVVMGDFSTLANRRADALKALVAFGVTQEQVFAKLGVEGAADIGLDHLVTLHGDEAGAGDDADALGRVGLVLEADGLALVRCAERLLGARRHEGRHVHRVELVGQAEAQQLAGPAPVQKLGRDGVDLAHRGRPPPARCPPPAAAAAAEGAASSSR